MISEVISKLVEGGDLSEKEVTAVFDLMMEGELPESQMAAFLTALRMKGGNRFRDNRSCQGPFG